MFILLSSLTGACLQTTDAKEGRQLCRTEGQKHGTQKKEKERKNTNSFQTTFLQKEACRRWRLTENDGTLLGFDFFFLLLDFSSKITQQGFGVVVFFLFFCGLFGDSGESNGRSQDVLRIPSLCWPGKAPGCFLLKNKKSSYLSRQRCEFQPFRNMKESLDGHFCSGARL